MSFNKITGFPPGFFAKMENLKYLIADHNHIARLDADLFPENSQLRNVFFNDNFLVEIDGNIFHALRNVKLLNFRNNLGINMKFPDDADLGTIASKMHEGITYTIDFAGELGKELIED